MGVLPRLMGGVVLVASILGAAPAADPSSEKSRSERLLALHADDAASYTFYRDAARSHPLELRRVPIYRWTNPTRVGGQTGDVFIWTDGGKPEVVASIFSHPQGDGERRVMCHELHSLSDAVILVERDSPNSWVPQAPGVDRKPIPGAPTPADSPARRLVQIRQIARQFSGRSLSDKNQAWELRLLPQPLYRYESTDPDVIDGAIFTLISSAGTDPEILLLIETRRTADGPRWEYGAARFSDMNLWLKYRNEDVWSSIRGGENTFNHDARHRFRFYQDRYIPELPDLASKPGAAKED